MPASASRAYKATSTQTPTTYAQALAQWAHSSTTPSTTALNAVPTAWPVRIAVSATSVLNHTISMCWGMQPISVSLNVLKHTTLMGSAVWRVSTLVSPALLQLTVSLVIMGSCTRADA